MECNSLTRELCGLLANLLREAKFLSSLTSFRDHGLENFGCKEIAEIGRCSVPIDEMVVDIKNIIFLFFIVIGTLCVVSKKLFNDHQVELSGRSVRMRCILE